MSSNAGETTEARPILLSRPGPRTAIARTGGGTPKVGLPDRRDQATRLGSKVRALEKAFSSARVVATHSLPETDPELVVVFETIDSRVDLTKAAERAGIEILMEAEEETEPDENFPRVNKRGELTGSDAPVPSCLHALCATQAQAKDLVSLWNAWVDQGSVAWGFGPFRQLFSHLHDVRPWGPQDRLRMAGVAERLDGLLDGQTIAVEIELWFRSSAATRSAVEDRVSTLVREEGGAVQGTATIKEVGYHAVGAAIPVSTLRRLAAGDYEDIAIVRSADVMYLRAVPQASAPASPGEQEELVQADLELPTAEPVLAILDGVPIANHHLLRDRIILHDPDDLQGDPAYTADRRVHGTAMTSILIWGDLSATSTPLQSPVVVRPVLRPDVHSGGEALEGALIPDLIRRSFVDIFGVDGSSGAAPSVQVINISLGDPAMPFDTIPSAWARTIDWLAAEYGVLIVVSAGNHPTLPVPGITGSKLKETASGDRIAVIADAMAVDAMNRRLLSPAEALNALTVGAMHEDATTDFYLGNRFDPSDGEPSISPVTAVGRGFKRSVKPELAAPGGRQLFQDPSLGGQPVVLQPAPVTRGPGIKAASWSAAAPSSGTSFVTGTSAAAALVSRRAAEFAEVLRDVASDGGGLTRAQAACALKALLVHEARWPEGLDSGSLPVDRLLGYGTRALDLVTGCAPNEIALIFVGEIGGQEQVTLEVPLPDGLQVSGTKRVAATVAWMSPVNWKHRQYRCAKLQFAKPVGLVASANLNTRDVSYALAGRGTVEQQVYETERASSAGYGDSMALTVKCEEQAGGLDGSPVSFAATVSLWVAPELNIDVYSQVSQQVLAAVQVPAQATPLR